MSLAAVGKINSAGRAGTLLGRFSTLVRDAVGLEPREIDLDLHDYLASKSGNGAAQEGSGGTNQSAEETEPADHDDSRGAAGDRAP